jgi:integrase
LIGAFLDDLESTRGITARSRNLRLTAIRSFFRFAAYEEPAQAALIQRVLAIRNKRHEKKLVGFLTRPEIAALLDVPSSAFPSSINATAEFLAGGLSLNVEKAHVAKDIAQVDGRRRIALLGGDVLSSESPQARSAQAVRGCRSPDALRS